VAALGNVHANLGMEAFFPRQPADKMTKEQLMRSVFRE
jgi:hypothetical protein